MLNRENNLLRCFVTNFNHHGLAAAKERLIEINLETITGIIRGMIFMVRPKPWVGICVFPLTVIQYSMAMLLIPRVKLRRLEIKAKYVESKMPFFSKSSSKNSKTLWFASPALIITI